MKNVLVMGGSYFVGRVFVEELRNRGEYSIHVINRGRRPLRLEGVNEVICDRKDAARLRLALPPLEWDAVVDFCAYDPQDVSTLIESLPAPPRKYVYISTVTVHQDSLTLPMTESTPILSSPLPPPVGDYAYKKWLTEQRLAELCEGRGVAHVSLRPAFIYGKYNYAPRESYFFDLVAREEPIIVPFAPQALFSMVSVWDVARICIACLGNEKVSNKAYIVCSEELISYDRIIQVLEEITLKNLYVQRQPVPVIETRRIPLPFPLTEHLIYSGLPLQEALRYRYMTFLEGMTDTYNWYRETRQR